MSRRCATEPTPRIDQPCRIRRVLVQIVTIQQPNRILVDEPPYIRIIEPESIVVKARAVVGVLSRIAERADRYARQSVDARSRLTLPTPCICPVKPGRPTITEE